MWKYTRERHGAVRTSELVDQLVSVHGWASALPMSTFAGGMVRQPRRTCRNSKSENMPRIEAQGRASRPFSSSLGRREQDWGQIIMNGKTVEPSTTAKLLGVILDRELRWKEHV